MIGYKSLAFIKFFVKRKKEQLNQEIGGAYKIMANGMTIQKQTSSTLKNPQRASVLPKSLVESFDDVNAKYYEKQKQVQDYKNSVSLSQPVAESLASDLLKDYKAENFEKITQKYDQKQENLDEKSNKAANTFNEKLNSLTQKFEQNQSNLNAEALDKGWKHSSIYEKESKQLEDDFLASKSLLENNHSQNQSALDFQKTLLLQEKQKALEDFNIAYAQKLSKKIEELTKDYNSAHKTEIKQAETREGQIQDMINQEKAKQLLNYLKSFSKDEANAFLRMHEAALEKELGNQVFVAIKSRF